MVIIKGDSEQIPKPSTTNIESSHSYVSKGSVLRPSRAGSALNLSSNGSTLTTSTCSIPRDEEDVHYYCKQMLHNKLFVGHYQERRYVDFISTYRDVVVIHKAEVEFKKDLDYVKARLHEFYEDNMWIGFTGPGLIGAPGGHALWVKLHDLPFGHYWFQIKQIKFVEREILLRLKVVRPLEMTDTIEKTVSAVKTASQQSIDLDSSPSNATTCGSKTEVNAEKDWTDSVPTSKECTQALTEWRASLIQNISYFFVNYVTFGNMKEVCRFFVAFLVAAATGVIHAIGFTGDFAIKFMREAALFVQASTPIMLGVIDFFTKLVGGMYILLAMMWRGRSIQAPGPEFRPTFRRPPLALRSSSSKMRYD